MYFLDCCISRNVVHVCPSGGTYCLGSSHTSHEVLERVLYLFIYLFMVLVYVNIFFFFLQFSDIEKCLKKKKKKKKAYLYCTPHIPQIIKSILFAIGEDWNWSLYRSASQ